MNIGLFFGSFNPIHNGHIGLAEKIIKKKQVELIWLVLSPQSPDKKSLLSKEARSELIEIALKNKNQIVLSKIEFELPAPNYTYKTLQLILKKFPENKYSIIMGDDNFANLNKWKKATYIKDNFQIIIYPRYDKDSNYLFSDYLFDISSSTIRERIKNNLSVKGMVPPQVEKKIREKRYYLDGS